MPDLLFLSQRIPFPPDKGDKIRSFHILEHLSRHWRVRLGCFVDDPADWRHLPSLERLCAEVRAVPLDRRRAMLRGIGGLLDGRPLTLPWFRDAGLARWAADTARTADAAFVYSSAMAQYVVGEARPRRLVLDLVDVDSDKWRLYAERRRGPSRWLYARESRRLLAFEREAARRADAVLLVSRPEADLFRNLAPEVAGKVSGIANGIDAQRFSPGDYANPYPGPGPWIVFTGAMDYWPNIDAVGWFAREILPLIAPEARFAVVGANPPPEVRALNALVPGRVPDMRPWLAHASMAVAPLRVARGIQNKVLEAMAMALPVVCTPQALEGIEASEVEIAADTPGFAEAIGRLLAAPNAARALGEAARRRVLADHAWPSRLARIEALLSSG